MIWKAIPSLSFPLIPITSHDIPYTGAAKHTDSPHDLLRALSLAAAVIIENPRSFDAGPFVSTQLYTGSRAESFTEQHSILV